MPDHRLILLICAAAVATVFTACRNRDIQSAGAAPVLMFSGRGTSPSDVAALEKILHREHLGYSLINTEQLNQITELKLLERRLLIIPGGDFEQMGRNLTPDAVAHIRSAIGRGLNYLGICAGAFFAGNSPYHGLNLTSGVRFGFYAAETRGIRRTAVSITDTAGHTLDQYWENGPQLTVWGAVVVPEKVASSSRQGEDTANLGACKCAEKQSPEGAKSSRRTAGQPSQELSQVLPTRRQQRVHSIADYALQVVSSQPAVVLHVADRCFNPIPLAIPPS